VSLNAPFNGAVFFALCPKGTGFSKLLNFPFNVMGEMDSIRSIEDFIMGMSVVTALKCFNGESRLIQLRNVIEVIEVLLKGL
jgi:hypothetical protein